MVQCTSIISKSRNKKMRKFCIRSATSTLCANPDTFSWHFNKAAVSQPQTTSNELFHPLSWPLTGIGFSRSFVRLNNPWRILPNHESKWTAIQSPKDQSIVSHKRRCYRGGGGNANSGLCCRELYLERCIIYAVAKFNLHINKYGPCQLRLLPVYLCWVFAQICTSRW